MSVSEFSREQINLAVDQKCVKSRFLECSILIPTNAIQQIFFLPKSEGIKKPQEHPAVKIKSDFKTITRSSG